jgi:glutathione S-transferase
MMTLYDNALSPFARKVRLVLDYKKVDYEAVDGLVQDNRASLASVNARVEVPALVHDGQVVANSSDIVGYLERAFPERPVYPASPAVWARARSWERCADTFLDSILVSLSYWTMQHRDDRMPDGLLDAARKDLTLVYDALERELAGREFVCGELSIADIALFPHLSTARYYDVSFDPARHPSTLSWFKRLRGLPIFADDLERARSFLSRLDTAGLERDKIFWRGDRIEWLLARGFHEWFFREIAEHRVLWPGPTLPDAGRA